MGGYIADPLSRKDIRKLANRLRSYLVLKGILIFQ